MKSPTDLKKALQNAHSEARRRSDMNGVRDDPDDSPVFDRGKSRRKLDALERDLRNIKNGWHDHDDGY